MADRAVRISVALVVLVGLIALAWFIGLRMIEDLSAEDTSGGRRRGGGDSAAPVAVAPIERGGVSQRLVVSGSLEANSAFLLAARVGGRLLQLDYHVGDIVERGVVVAQLDDRSYRQAQAEAEASLSVAQARLKEAESAVGLSQRRAERLRKLEARGVASEAERDSADGEQVAAEAAVTVARAQVAAAEAALAGARLDLADCSVRAEWDGDDKQRVVGQRFVDAGALLDSGEALFSVIDIDPLMAVLHVDESTYGRLSPGQQASLHCDAFPGETFVATVARIAPRFDPNSRQARIELQVANADGRLKPGMFTRITLVLATVDDAILVPETALVSRRGDPVVFVVASDGKSVVQRPVTVGLRDAGMVQVTGEGLEGQVVVLGQQLIADGSSIVIPDDDAAEAPGP